MSLLICFPVMVVLLATYFDIEQLNAPFQCLLVGVEKYVEPVSADSAASVEDFYKLGIAVAGDDHFTAERVFFVGCYEGVAGSYFVPASRLAVRIFAAALLAGAIGGYPHSHSLPLLGLFRHGFCFRFIQNSSTNALRRGDGSAEYGYPAVSPGANHSGDAAKDKNDCRKQNHRGHSPGV